MVLGFRPRTSSAYFWATAHSVSDRDSRCFQSSSDASSMCSDTSGKGRLGLSTLPWGFSGSLFSTMQMVGAAQARLEVVSHFSLHPPARPVRVSLGGGTEALVDWADEARPVEVFCGIEKPR